MSRLCVRWPWHHDPTDREQLAETERELARVRGQWPIVLQYAAVLRVHRERNHFAESIDLIFRGGKP